MFIQYIGKKEIKEFFSFGFIGVINTIYGFVGMFFLYNIIHWNYWWSTSFVYITGSLWSFYMNKKYTFKNTDNIFLKLVYFIINIAACYTIAYVFAIKIVTYLIEKFKWVIAIDNENIAMLVGMFLFVILNFLGQKYIVFQKKES